MSPIETQDVLSEDITTAGDNDNTKLVPVAESIRYRKRAQSAEKKAETLSEQLSQANSQVKQMGEQLEEIQTEQKLTRKLAAAGTVDVETAVMLAKAKLQGQSDEDMDSVVEQLRSEKQYLFASNSGNPTTKKTSGVKERISNNQTALERAAKRAAATGNRKDLQEYLKMRRNYL